MLHHPRDKSRTCKLLGITPSAAIGIYRSILGKAAVNWEITKIEVLNPIKYYNFIVSEVTKLASAKVKAIDVSDENTRTMKKLTVLKNVKYRIHARMLYNEVDDRFIPDEHKSVMKERPDENIYKYIDMFIRRASKGQQYRQIHLGLRDFIGFYRLVNPEEENLQKPIDVTMALGLTFYDFFKVYDPKTREDVICDAMRYNPVIKDGVVEVPPVASDRVIKPKSYYDYMEKKGKL